MTRPSECWHCVTPFSSSWPFCAVCNRLQSCPDGGNAFEILGISPSLSIDEGALTSRFFELSRQFHPDFFGHASPEEQAYSLAHSARLNDAYRGLQGFKGRVDAYLEAFGLGDALEAWKPPASMLMQVLDWNEELDELAGRGPTERETALARIRGEVRSSREAILEAIPQMAASSESLGGQHQKDSPVTKELLDMVGRIQYISRLLERIEHLN
jgi:molecular chaperone HscB